MEIFEILRSLPGFQRQRTNFQPVEKFNWALCLHWTAQHFRFFQNLFTRNWQTRLSFNFQWFDHLPMHRVLCFRQGLKAGAPNENIVQNHLNIA